MDFRAMLMRRKKPAKKVVVVSQQFFFHLIMKTTRLGGLDKKSRNRSRSKHLFSRLSILNIDYLLKNLIFTSLDC
jgi:hypothetical protein